MTKQTLLFSGRFFSAVAIMQLFKMSGQTESKIFVAGKPLPQNCGCALHHNWFTWYGSNGESPS